MTTLTEEQISVLNYKECKDALKTLNKTYPLDVPIKELTAEQWAFCDDITNTLLWLEDRIKSFEDQRILSMNPNDTQSLPVKNKPEIKLEDTRRPSKRFSMQGVIYENVKVAALKTGIKIGTLRTYVTRKPDQYFYVD
jgi:hypothetical protein